MNSGLQDREMRVRNGCLLGHITALHGLKKTRESSLIISVFSVLIYSNFLS
jgi:hypothetical protein